MITSAKYAQDGSVTAIVDGQEISNITEANWQWAQVKEWVADGHAITPSFNTGSGATFVLASGRGMMYQNSNHSSISGFSSTVDQRL